MSHSWEATCDACAGLLAGEAEPCGHGLTLCGDCWDACGECADEPPPGLARQAWVL